MPKKRIGVVGHPVGHSMSPVMHNAAFRSLSLPYEYEAFDVKEEDLASFVSEAKGCFAGLNVTIPHKVAVMGLLDELSSEAALIGAVNTIRFDDGKAVGYNTDGVGCVKAIEEAGLPVRDERVLILGAGGAARAIAFQCVLSGAHVSLSNRNRDRAVSLARNVSGKTCKKIHVVDYAEEHIGEELLRCDLLINTTPVGMSPGVADSPISASVIPRDVAVMDIVYNPIETRLLREARERGCRTIGGAGMLVNQGAEALRLMLGVEPPVDVMRTALIGELKKK